MVLPVLWSCCTHKIAGEGFGYCLHCYLFVIIYIIYFFVVGAKMRRRRLTDGRPGTILASEVDIYISMKTDHCFSKELQRFLLPRGGRGDGVRGRGGPG